MINKQMIFNESVLLIELKLYSATSPTYSLMILWGGSFLANQMIKQIILMSKYFFSDSKILALSND